MRYLSQAMVVAITTFSTVSPAAADPLTFHTTAGKVVNIGHFATWGGDCSPGVVPWITITKKPANGTLDTALSEFDIKSITFGGTKCIGKKAKGVFLYYTPNKSFNGSDNVEYYVNYINKIRHDYSVQITVK